MRLHRCYDITLSEDVSLGVAITEFVAWLARCPICEISPNMWKKYTLLLRLRFVLVCNRSFPEIG
jgi:hypothetical protein